MTLGSRIALASNEVEETVFLSMGRLLTTKLTPAIGKA